MECEVLDEADSLGVVLSVVESDTLELELMVSLNELLLDIE